MSLTLTQDSPLSLDRAWHAWTTNDGLQEWWWPMWPDTDYRFEPERERQYRIASEAMQFGVSGEFTRVEKPHALDLTWRWDGDDGEPQAVTVRLDEHEGGTRCVVTHDCRPEEEKDLRQGWTDVLARFGQLR